MWSEYVRSKTNLNKPQVLQNAAARVVIKAHKSDRLTIIAVRKDLHWIPVEARTDFKILMLTWKAYHNISYKYLNELLHKKYFHRNCSTDDYLLDISTTRLITWSDWSFHLASPVLYNELPIQICSINKLNTFKNNLETYLLSKYYNTLWTYPDWMPVSIF